MTIKIKIGGMHCGGCVSSVEKAARAIEGVSNVSVSLDDNALTADLAGPELLEALTGAIEDSGFDVLNTSV